MSMDWDLSAWHAGLKSWAKTMETRAVAGMREASENLLKDEGSEDPTIPFDTGELIGTGGHEGYKDGSTVVGAVWFGTPYAAYQHEGVRRDGTHRVKNYTTLGSGKNYLRFKMLRNKGRYFKTVMRHMANG